MKKWGMVAAAAVLGLVVAMSGTANAQFVKGQFLVGPGAGAAIPMGDFGDAADIGFGFGGVGDYMLTPNLAVGADFMYNMLGAKVEEDLEDVSVDDFKLLQITGHAKYFFGQDGAKMTPYLFGGAGFYNMKGGVSVDIGDIDLDVSASSTEFGVNGGAGMLFKAGEKMKVGVQGAFHNVMTEGDATQYISAGAFLLFTFGAQQ
ncbi:MAG: outer membrane beta-barrel protein [Candidatus Zixiibacteriota bacterium]